MEIAKILQIGSENLGRGGRSVIIYNVTRELDNRKFKIDFLSLSENVDSFYKNKIESRGGNVVICTPEGNNKLKSEYVLTRKLIRTIKSKKYNIVHINADNAWEAAKSVIISRIAGVKKIIVHAHNTGFDKPCSYLKKIVINISKVYLKSSISGRIACSVEAAKFLFGDKNTLNVKILKNGISIENYLFDEDKRITVRNDLKLKDKFVVVFVGRLEKQKNPLFLIDIFYRLKQKKDCVLLVIGDGSMKEQMINKAENLCILDSIVFLGNRKDVSDLLQASDVFVLPSIFEGFGIVNLEAQASGLPCFVSTEIPAVAAVNPNFYRVPLSKGVDYWVKLIIEKSDVRFRGEIKENFINKQYDIKQSAKELEKYYEELL